MKVNEIYTEGVMDEIFGSQRVEALKRHTTDRGKWKKIVEFYQKLKNEGDPNAFSKAHKTFGVSPRVLQDALIAAGLDPA